MNAWPRTLLQAALVALANLAFVLWFGGFARADLGVPLHYDGDALHYLAVIRGIVDNGWFFENARLGAPFGHVHRDFPVPDVGFLLAVRLLGAATSNPFVIFNLLFLGTLALVPFAAFVAARRLGTPAWLAAGVAVAFNLLPFHFQRIGHLFYTGYFTIPVYVFVAMRLLQGHSALGMRRGLLLRLAAVGACATFGLYYAVFAMALLAFAALAAWARSRPAAVEAVLLCGAIVAVLVACLAPNIVHRMEHGANAAAAARSASEGEYYALRPSLLVMPPASHRLGPFAAAGARFDATAPLVNENRTAWIGTAGAVGLLLSVLAVLGIALRGAAYADLLQLARANVFMLLFATMGGLGALFNYWVWPQIRAYNRASVFIAFLSLLVLALAVTRRWPLVPRLKAPFAAAALAALCAVVAADQLMPQGTLAHLADASRARFEPHARFGAALQAALPASAMVFQLPHVVFPESPPAHRAAAYDGFAPYLHTRDLRFSFGAMRSRAEAIWLDALAARKTEALVPAAEASGFAAVLVDRDGYADAGAAVIAALRAAGKRVVAEDARYVAFALDPPAGARARPPQLEWSLGAGFHNSEAWADGNGAWCRGRCTIQVRRSKGVGMVTTTPLDAALDMVVEARGERTITVAAGGREAVAMARGAPPMARVRVSVPAGVDSLAVTFDTPDAPHVAAPGDPRLIAYRVFDLRFADPAPVLAGPALDALPGPRP